MLCLWAYGWVLDMFAAVLFWCAYAGIVVGVVVLFLCCGCGGSECETLALLGALGAKMCGWFG
jgi:hypothetical protein